jgi:hypothetical protein
LSRFCPEHDFEPPQGTGQLQIMVIETSLTSPWYDRNALLIASRHEIQVRRESGSIRNGTDTAAI